MEQYNEGEADETRRLEIDSAEEVRELALLQSARYLQGVCRHYDKHVQPCTIQIGDLVLCRIQDTFRRLKLLSPWEAPFIVVKVTRLGSFELITKVGVPISDTWHIDQLCRFYT